MTTNTPYNEYDQSPQPQYNPGTGTGDGPGRKPAYHAYQVRDGSNGKSYWNRVGAAWPNRAGGFTLQLESIPLDGRIVLQPPKASEDGGY